jgi:hypothetical protein
MAVAAAQQPSTDDAGEVWAPGSAVLALGTADDGADALALWQVSPTGTASGAWVVSQDEAFSSREAARRLLIGFERRATTALDPAQVDGIVEKLTAAAGLEAERWWSSHVFSAVDAFGELVARRAAYDATVVKARESGKNAAALEWARDFPADAAPDGFEGLRELSGLSIAAGAPVVSEVLTVSRVLKWLVGVWAETEQVKNRRPYVRDVHGGPEGLPPLWLAAVQTANATRLPL